MKLEHDNVALLNTCAWLFQHEADPAVTRDNHPSLLDQVKAQFPADSKPKYDEHRLRKGLKATGSPNKDNGLSTVIE